MPAEEGIQRLKSLDSSFISGALPYALRAALRAFKSDPFRFVAGMTVMCDSSGSTPFI